MKNQLQKGDVFEVKAGMMVYADIPERYVYQNQAYSMKQTQTEVKAGKVYTAVTSQLGLALIYMANAAESHLGINIPQGDILGFVRKYLPALPETYDTKDIMGEYVVTGAKYCGGDREEGYPDGWFIVAKKLNSDGTYNEAGTKINFYQSGAFSIVNEYVPVIRKMAVIYKTETFIKSEG